jgi:hypothetical protein
MSRTSAALAFTLMVLSLVAGPASSVTTAGFRRPREKVPSSPAAAGARAGGGTANAPAVDSSGVNDFKLNADGGASADNFGRGVAMSGNTVAVRSNGSTCVFVRSAAGWTQQQTLPGGGPVALDGDTIAVGHSGAGR